MAGDRRRGADRPLIDRMNEYARKGGPRAVEVAEMATKLEDALDRYYAPIQQCSACELVGHWARTRRLWKEVTGEALIYA